MRYSKTQNLIFAANRKLDHAQYHAAIKLFKKALTLASSQDKIHLYLGIAHAERMRARFALSAVFYKRTLALASRHHDKTAEIDARVGLAMCTRATEQYDQTYRQLRKAAQSYRALKDLEGLAHVTWFLGGTLRLLGQLQKSYKAFQNSYYLFKKIKNPVSTAYALCGLGGIQRVQGHPRASLSFYQKAHAYFLQLRDPFGLAYAACGIGNALRILNRLQESKKWTLLSIRRYHRLKDTVNVGYTYFTLAMLLLRKGNLKKAACTITKMQRLFHAVYDRRGKIYVYLALSQLALNQEKNARSLAYLKKAAHLAKQLKLPLEQLYTRHASLRDISPALARAYKTLDCNPAYLQSLQNSKTVLNFY